MTTKTKEPTPARVNPRLSLLKSPQFTTPKPSFSSQVDELLQNPMAQITLIATAMLTAAFGPVVVDLLLKLGGM